MKKKSRTASKAAPVMPARLAPVEQLHRCPACSRLVPLLVEGSDLCMRCDHLHFPELVIA